MPKAIWKDTILAESNDTIVVEGNHYFPPDSIRREYFKESEHRTVCPWKGTASYYNVEIDGQVARNAAWYYPAPKDAAKQIKDYVAFWGDVRVVSDRTETEERSSGRSLLDRLRGALG